MRSPFGWFFWLLAGLIIVQGLFYLSGGQAEEISWTQFRQNLLQENAIDRITVINRERAEIFIRPELLGEGEFAKIDSESAGPHYTLLIGSLENFEQTLSEVQSDIPPEERAELEYVQRTDWTGAILAWIIPVALLVLLWMFILNRVRRSGQFSGRNLFDFGKSGAKTFEKGQSNITFEEGRDRIAG